MMDGTLATIAALGLAISLWGTLKAMAATPLVGGDEDGYLAIDSARQVKDLVSRQKAAWRLLCIGFCLQLAGAVGIALLAFVARFQPLAVGTVNSTSLALRDAQGRLRIELSAAGARPSLRFFDTTGVTKISLEIDSTIAEPALSLYAGRDMNITGRFAADAMGASVTTLLDGRLQGSMTALSVSPVILFTGPDLGARLELKAPRPRIAFVDADGNVTATLAQGRP